MRIASQATVARPVVGEVAGRGASRRVTSAGLVISARVTSGVAGSWADMRAMVLRPGCLPVGSSDPARSA